MKSEFWFGLQLGLVVLVLWAFSQANLFKPSRVLPDNYYCFHTATPYQQWSCQRQQLRVWSR